MALPLVSVRIEAVMTILALPLSMSSVIAASQQGITSMPMGFSMLHLSCIAAGVYSLSGIFVLKVAACMPSDRLAWAGMLSQVLACLSQAAMYVFIHLTTRHLATSTPRLIQPDLMVLPYGGVAEVQEK